MRPLRLHFRVPSKVKNSEQETLLHRVFSSSSSSLLGRHIIQLKPQWRIYRSAFAHLASYASQLQRIRGIVCMEFPSDDEKDDDVDASFPRELVELDLDLQTHATAALQTMAQQCLNLHTLVLRLTLPCSSVSSLASLALLPRLTSLELLTNTELHDVHVNELRALTKLRTLKLDRGTVWPRLLRAPCPLTELQTTWACFSSYCDDPVAQDDRFFASLVNVAHTLTELHVYAVHCSEWQWLPQLTSLRTLDLVLASEQGDIGTYAYMDVLERCNAIQTLHLWLKDSPPSPERLGDVLASLPHLSCLHLENTYIPLSFLGRIPHLKVLHLESAELVTHLSPSIELCRIHKSLTSLRELTLHEYAFGERGRLNLAACLQAYAPPSRLMPSLQRFTFQPVRGKRIIRVSDMMNK
jgi:hypothetical protein